MLDIKEKKLKTISLKWNIYNWPHLDGISVWNSVKKVVGPPALNLKS